MTKISWKNCVRKGGDFAFKLVQEEIVPKTSNEIDDTIVDAAKVVWDIVKTKWLPEE